MAQPMVGGIYTADPETLSLRATMPRFLEMEREHRSLILAMWKAARRSRGGAKHVSTASDERHVRAASGAQHGREASGARYSLFLSFDEGTQVLTDTLAARLPVGTLRLNTKVESITFESDTNSEHDNSERDARHWLLKTNDGETISADAV